MAAYSDYGVLVTAIRNENGTSDKYREWSGSGFIHSIHGNDVYVITSGTWMKGLINIYEGDTRNNYRVAIPSDAQFSIIHKSLGDPGLLSSHSCHVRASSVMCGVCHVLRDLFQTSLNGWAKYSSHAGSKEWVNGNEDDLDLLMMSTVVLLQLSSDRRKSIPSVGPRLSSLEPHPQGHPLYIISTPFGSFYPQVFLNSLSVGVVSSKCGRLCLTDARCTEGCEGGAVIAMDEVHHNRCVVVGMVVAVLADSADNNTVGMSLAVSMSAILDVLDIEISQSLTTTTSTDRILRGAWSLLVGVVCDEMHGSGVLVTDDLVLTCGHVIKNRVSGTVKVHISDRSQIADILYSSLEDSAPDIALLHLSHPTKSSQDFLEAYLCDSKMTSQVKQGDDVYAIGLSCGNSRAGPLVTKGIVSSVVHSGTEVVMLQTTCSVHSGMSGGLIWWAGHPVGLIACNTRLDSADRYRIYHNVSFAIPFSWLASALGQYIKTRDTAVFSGYSLNKEVNVLWNFSPRSKL